MTSQSAHTPTRPLGLASLWALEGRWGLTREVRHEDGRIDRLEGITDFLRSGPRLIQDETGSLTVESQVLEARQRYVWEDAGGQLNVHFADLRPFHTVMLNAPEPTAVHLCPPDRYEVRYDFRSWPRWRATWTVEGPRKSYVMTSNYRR